MQRRLRYGFCEWYTLPIQTVSGWVFGAYQSKRSATSHAWHNIFKPVLLGTKFFSYKNLSGWLSKSWLTNSNIALISSSTSPVPCKVHNMAPKDRSHRVQNQRFEGASKDLWQLQSSVQEMAIVWWQSKQSRCFFIQDKEGAEFRGRE